MEFEKFMKAQALTDAKLGFTEALATGETPEQAAMRLQKARTFNVAPAAVEIVSPEEEAAHRADLVDWAALQVQAPELLKRLNDPAFATLVCRIKERLRRPCGSSLPRAASLTVRRPHSAIRSFEGSIHSSVRMGDLRI